MRREGGLGRANLAWAIGSRVQPAEMARIGCWRAPCECPSVSVAHDGAKLTVMTALRASSLRHVRPVVPLRFPEQEPDSERMGQSKRHREICEAFYQMVKQAVGREHAKGADQFVYFDAANPRRCLAPDTFVKLRVRNHIFETWKVWELGTPEFAVES